MQPVPLPAPFLGVEESIPTISIQSPFCEYLLNFNPTQNGAELRHGDVKFNKVGGGVGTEIGIAMAPYSSTKLLLLTRQGATTEIIDVETGTVEHTVGAVVPSFRLTTLVFNNYLFFLNPDSANPGWYYNGSAYGNIGYTGSGFAPLGGNVFKKRAYIIQDSISPIYWYSEISAISGALTQIDLSTVVSEKGSILIIAKITLADTVQSVVLQAFVISTGEVIFYSGSYPDSNDWEEVGRGKVGEILKTSLGLEYQGDYLIFCKTGVVSLRDLFLKGSGAAASLILNKAVKKTWQTYAIAAESAFETASGFLRAVWDRANERIIIFWPGVVNDAGVFDENAGSFQFIFDTVLKAWFFHISAGPGSDTRPACYYKNKVLFATAGNENIMIYEKEGADDFTDRNYNDLSDVGYDYEIISAPVTNGRAYVQQAVGLDVILNSDLFAETEYTLIKDLGVDETNPQVLSGVPEGTIQKPFVNMGIEGSYVQYKIAGTTVAGKSVGLQIYGTNLWIEQGASPR